MALREHKNRSMAALPTSVWKAWAPQLEAVKLPLGEVLYESGATLSHVYVPAAAIASGLEARTCECYAVVKKEYDRLLL